MKEDMKNLMNQNSLQSFGDISNGMQGMLGGILKQSFNVDSLIQQAKEKALNPITPMSNLMNVKDWIPNMPVTAGEKIRFRNNIFTAEKSGRTGTSLPSERGGTQQNGNTTLKFDSFVEGEGKDIKYGDVGPNCNFTIFTKSCIPPPYNIIHFLAFNDVNHLNIFGRDIPEQK